MPRLHVAITNDTREIVRLNDAFNGFAAEHGVPDKVRRQCLMAFDDLITNIVHYAYPDSGEHEIDVQITLDGGLLAIRIADDGAPFDPFAADEVDTSLDLDDRDIGGLGIHLVRSLMDSAEYERDDAHNVVRLTKHIT